MINDPAAMAAPGTLYQPIPQAPQTPSILELSVDELEGRQREEPEEDDGLAGLDDLEGIPIRHGGELPVSNVVRWIHFILGAAVLLPWNGACILSNALYAH